MSAPTDTTTAPVTEATDPTPTQTPEPAPAAPTATPAPAEAAAALLPGDPTLGVDVAVPEDTEPLPLPTAEEMAAAIDAWDPAQADAEMGPVGMFTDQEDEEADPAPSPLAAACAAGTVRLFRLRGTGTTRRLTWLAGEALETAEWYRLRCDQGATVRQVAEECETSKATVRRALNTLALMDEIEEGMHDTAYEEGVTELWFGAEDDGEDA